MGGPNAMPKISEDRPLDQLQRRSRRSSCTDLDIHENDDSDEGQLSAWIEQASKLSTVLLSQLPFEGRR